MRNFYITASVLLLLTFQLKAQAPNSLNYQGVARNASGMVLTNQNISLRFTIHQTTATGAVVYQETQSPVTTNQLGLFTAAIGSGTVVSGNFATIGWGTNTEFLQVEMDPTGGNSYIDMGTNQYLSVPYALSAGSSSSAWNLAGNTGISGTNYLGTTDANDLIFKAHNNEVMRVGNTNSNVGIGTTTPNAGAELDITSSTQGLLIPRMTANPATPAQGMMYFNTSTGCFMFYTGSVWNAMVCPCPNTPATPGSITGPSSSVCPNATGLVYSIAPINNAISYAWTVPTGATVTAGQGSNIITVTMGGTAGNVAVAAVNNCATGAASTQAITLVPSIITGQPANTFACGSTNATFTVTASGSPTYQWQVSTNGGTSYASVANNATYTNVTTATLTVTSPQPSMNGYLYECVVTSGCSFISNPATLSIRPNSVPITLTNAQAGTTTSAGLQVMVTVNSSTFSGNGEDLNLDNVEFTTGPGATGTVLNAWLESATNTPPTSASTSTVYWVNLGSTTITNGMPLKIYMNFTSSPVMTSKTSVTGEAPQLSSTYGAFDNGALVFPNVYTAYGGLSGGTLPTGISQTGTVTITNNPTNTVMTLTSGSIGGVIYTAMPSSAVGTTVDETYAAIFGAYLWWGVGTGTSDGASPGIDLTYDSGANGSKYIGKASNNTALTTTVTAPSNTPAVWSISLTSNTSLQAFLYNYASVYAGVPLTITSIAAAAHYGFYGTSQNGTPSGSNNTATIYWTRTRTFPPNGVLPTVAVGAYGCN